MIKEIVFATNNKHKLQELREIAGNKFKILSLNDINCHEDIAETGITLRENALIKAQFIHEKYGYDCFADDTGLMIDALNGEPGVYSARYAGEDCNSENNIDKVLSKLSGNDNRTARFTTVIVLILNNNIHYFEGCIEGSIGTERQGTDGFGYDSIFIPEKQQHSFAQMSSEEKNSMSHRGRATKKLIEYLNSIQLHHN